jgi:hypothetical protein
MRVISGRISIGHRFLCRPRYLFELCPVAPSSDGGYLIGDQPNETSCLIRALAAYLGHDGEAKVSVEWQYIRVGRRVAARGDPMKGDYVLRMVDAAVGDRSCCLLFG